MSNAGSKLVVTHVINELVFAGAELLVVGIAIAQAKEGLSVSIVVLGSVLPEISVRLKSFNVTCFSLDCLASRYCSLFGFPRLASILNQIRPNVIHSHLFPSQYYVAFYRKLFRPFGVVFITTEHSTYNRRRKYKLFKYIDSAVFKEYNTIACISEPVRSSLIDWIPKLASRMKIFTNGVDIDSIRQATPVNYEKEFGICMPVILCVGRLFYVKGQDIAIRSLQHLPAAALVLLGSGPEKKHLELLAKQFRVSDRVFFLEARPDVYRFMKGCSVYIQPSRWEGFGLAALEALASGAKVICSNVSGMQNQLEPLGATIFNSEDHYSLAEMVTMSLQSSSSSSSFLLPEDLSLNFLASLYATHYATVISEVLSV